MNKLPGIGRYEGMPVSLVKTRKPHTCKECLVALPKGSSVYRPILMGSVNDVIRCNRVCPDCMKAVGQFLPGS